jgi:diguanylate cyclase (GGDEF)-like protein
VLAQCVLWGLPMHLDMQTMSAVNVAVTSVLGGVLLFNWVREHENPLVGLWGLGLIVQAAGVVLATAAAPRNSEVLVILGTAAIIFGDALKWKAAREFAHRPARIFWLLSGPAVFLLATTGGYLGSFDRQLNAVCTIIAIYNFATALEFARLQGEPLTSRMLAVVLLVIVGLSYLSWLPLNAVMPIKEAQAAMISFWFPATILLTVLLRTALAFTVLSLAKERREFEQRVDALTDALTGLANRRALFEAVDALSQDREPRRGAAVLIFDLDHFKETNDRFGHALGDRVLKLFASTVRAYLDGASIVARLGGEEFVVILPGAGPLEAAGAAETVRQAFAKAGASVDGLPLGATVSVGVAWEPVVTGDLNALFRRADAALYVAKRSGRNRVEMLGPDDENPLAEVEAALRYARRASLLDLAEPGFGGLRA